MPGPWRPGHRKGHCPSADPGRRRSGGRVARARGGEPFLLYMEIQNSNDNTMPLWMMRYRTDILLAHPGLPLRQHLIYIGREPLTMPDGIDAEGLHYSCVLLEKGTLDAMLHVLSVNRDLGERIREAEKTLTRIDIERDSLLPTGNGKGKKGRNGRRYRIGARERRSGLFHALERMRDYPGSLRVRSISGARMVVSG